MGRQIVKQPNGKYAIWSTVVDNFIGVNYSKEDIIEKRIKEESKDIRKDIGEIIDGIEKGGTGYIYNKSCLPVDDFEDGVDMVKLLHDEEEYDKLMKFLNENEVFKSK